MTLEETQSYPLTDMGQDDSAVVGGAEKLVYLFHATDTRDEFLDAVQAKNRVHDIDRHAVAMCWQVLDVAFRGTK
jgi:hypothetical protein